MILRKEKPNTISKSAAAAGLKGTAAAKDDSSFFDRFVQHLSACEEL